MKLSKQPVLMSQSFRWTSGWCRSGTSYLRKSWMQSLWISSRTDRQVLAKI